MQRKCVTDEGRRTPWRTGKFELKWGNPVFEYRGKGLSYLQGRKDYLRFGFFEQATQLDDPEGLLEGTGKAMRHVKIRADPDIRPIFQEWLKHIAAMNEQAASRAKR